jgi:purine-binding chemotaxis protein CheW
MAVPGDAGSTAPTPGEARRFCVRAGTGRYAFDAALVSEVVRLGALTRLPGAPPSLPGGCIHRGAVLAVLVLCQVRGQAAVTPGPSSRVAVLSVGPWRLALLADALEGLCTLTGEVERPPADGGPAAAWLAGVGRDARGPLALLDLPRLIQAARDRSVRP